MRMMTTMEKRFHAFCAALMTGHSCDEGMRMVMMMMVPTMQSPRKEYFYETSMTADNNMRDSSPIPARNFLHSTAAAVAVAANVVIVESPR